VVRQTDFQRFKIAIINFFYALDILLAGDGIIYSFAFAVVLDLRTQSKPDFSANLRLNWQLGNRTWLPRHRFSISEEIVFSKSSELDGGDAPSISSRNMGG
jgi:hypothetical protein